MQGRTYSGYRTEHSTEHGTEHGADDHIRCCRVHGGRIIDSALWSGMCLVLLCQATQCSTWIQMVPSGTEWL